MLFRPLLVRTLLVAAGVGLAAGLVVLRAQSAAHPAIQSFTPASGPVGTRVTIHGAWLDHASSVAVGNTECSRFTVDSTEQITVQIPDGAASGPLAVVTPGGRAVSADSFTVLAH